MSADARTIAVYNARAGDYDDCFRQDRPDRHLQAFIDALPHPARVLDLGCGPATASAFLRAAGHDPDPVDASSAMVALANERHAIGARLASFDEIDAVAAYDGVWANFSLLHAARSDLPRHLGALHRALKAGELLHLGMKTGTGEGPEILLAASRPAIGIDSLEMQRHRIERMAPPGGRLVDNCLDRRGEFGVADFVHRDFKRHAVSLSNRAAGP